MDKDNYTFIFLKLPYHRIVNINNKLNILKNDELNLDITTLELYILFLKRSNKHNKTKQFIQEIIGEYEEMSNGKIP